MKYLLLIALVACAGCKKTDDGGSAATTDSDSVPVTATTQATTGTTGSTGTTGATGVTGIAATGLVLNLDAAKANAGTGYTNCSGATWTDSSSQNNSATISGTSGCIAGTSGWSGNGTAANPYALAFDGVDDMGSHAGAAGFVTGSGARSITAWIYRLPGNVTNDVGMIFGYGTATEDDSFGVGINNALNLYTGAWSNDLRSVETISNNTWTHIGITYDGSGSMTTSAVKGFIGGTGVTMTGSGIGRTGQPFSTIGTAYTIGANPVPGYYFNGKISSVQVYDRALSPVEVRQNCDADKARFQGATCGP